MNLFRRFLLTTLSSAQYARIDRRDSWLNIFILNFSVRIKNGVFQIVVYKHFNFLARSQVNHSYKFCEMFKNHHQHQSPLLNCILCKAIFSCDRSETKLSFSVSFKVKLNPLFKNQYFLQIGNKNLVVNLY